MVANGSRTFVKLFFKLLQNNICQGLFVDYFSINKELETVFKFYDAFFGTFTERVQYTKRYNVKLKELDIQSLKTVRGYLKDILSRT